MKIQSFASQLLKEGVCSVRTLAKFIGQAVASFRGVMYGPLWYRALEKTKREGLCKEMVFTIPLHCYQRRLK